ncbi:hypothetical protein D3C72_1319560 [compost metagenome]
MASSSARAWKSPTVSTSVSQAARRSSYCGVASARQTGAHASRFMRKASSRSDAPGTMPDASGAPRSSVPNQPWKVSMAMRPGAASTCACRRRARGSASRAASGVSPRCTSAAMTSSSGSRDSCASTSSRRSRISSAALRVKVIARISCGAAPASSRRTRRATSSQVLPLPAQASTTTERAGSQAARVNSASDTGWPSRW